MILYHLISIFASVIVAPCFALYSLFTKKKGERLFEHLGIVAEDAERKSGKTIWIHALSLGEVMAAAPMLKHIHEQHPELRFVVTVTTDSGYDGAHRHLGFADRILFHPLDCLPFTLAALKRIHPDVFVLTDTGFWPGLLDLLHRRGIPALLFNGRLSRRSARRYQFLGPLAKSLFENFRLLCMQNAQGEEAMRALGIDASRIRVIGDPKYDSVQPLSAEDRARIRENLGLADRTPVWVAGSIHLREEEIVLDAYAKLHADHRDLVLILAPRRMERVDSVARLLRKRGIASLKRSEIMEGNLLPGKIVILLDTMGELAELYAIGFAAFVGKSLVAPGGGHSLIEPVAQGVAVLHGPYIDHMRHVADVLKPHGLSIAVKNADEMAKAIDSLLADAERRKELAEKGPAVLREFQGASHKMAQLVLENLKD